MCNEEFEWHQLDMSMILREQETKDNYKQHSSPMHSLTTTVEEPLKKKNVPYSSTINMTVQSLISPITYCIQGSIRLRVFFHIFYPYHQQKNFSFLMIMNRNKPFGVYFKWGKIVWRCKRVQITQGKTLYTVYIQLIC